MNSEEQNKVEDNETSGGDYKEANKALKAAWRSWLCAVHLVRNVDNAEVEIGLHLSRAWHSVAKVQGCMGVGKEEETLPNLVNCDNLPFTNKMPRPRWRSQLEALQALMTSSEKPGDEEIALTPAELREHIDFLERVLNSLAREVRSHYGVPLISKKAVKWTFIVLAVVVLAVVIGVVVRRIIQGPPAWRAFYFENRDIQGPPTASENHHSLDFNWGSEAPFVNFPIDNFSIVFETCLVLKEKVNGVFELGSDDGSRLKINGEEVIDNWGFHAMEVKRGKYEFEPGVHHIRAEYFEAGGDAAVFLKAFPAKLLTKAHLRAPRGEWQDADTCAHLR